MSYNKTITNFLFEDQIRILAGRLIWDEGDITLDYPKISQARLNMFTNALVFCTTRITIKNITSSVKINSSALKSVGSLYIINNPGLTEISGFKSLTNTSTIYIKNNPKLKTIIGFNNLVGSPSIYINKLGPRSLKKMPNIMPKAKKMPNIMPKAKKMPNIMTKAKKISNIMAAKRMSNIMAAKRMSNIMAKSKTANYYVIKSKAKLTYKRVKGKTIRLAWSKPVYNPGIKAFRVYKAPKQGSKYKLIKTVKNVNNRVLITTGVKGNLFKVLAVNVNGSFSSNIITIK